MRVMTARQVRLVIGSSRYDRNDEALKMSARREVHFGEKEVWTELSKSRDWSNNGRSTSDDFDVSSPFRCIPSITVLYTYPRPRLRSTSQLSKSRLLTKIPLLVDDSGLGHPKTVRCSYRPAKNSTIWTAPELTIDLAPDVGSECTEVGWYMMHGARVERCSGVLARERRMSDGYKM
jgi:hypothetical protein